MKKKKCWIHSILNSEYIQYEDKIANAAIAAILVILAIMIALIVL